MKKLWILFIAIFVASFAVLGWVGTEIFRQAPPIPRAVVTTDGKVVVSGDDIQNGKNVWQAMGGMEMGSIWGHGSYVAPDWTADYLHNESVMILDQWSQNQFTKSYNNISSEEQAMLRQRLQDMRTGILNRPDLFLCGLEIAGIVDQQREIAAVGHMIRQDLDGLPEFTG